MNPAKTKLLLVEDDPKELEILCSALSKQGYEVQVALDGEAGVALVEAFNPEVILLDVMLPKLNGLEACRHIRQELQCATPIIMLTAMDKEQDVIRGLHTGADDYLVKPFRIGELCARIEAVQRRGPAGHTRSYTFGDCTLNFDSQVLTRKEKPVPLTAQEYSLLSYLLANEGRVLTRESILDAIETRSQDTDERSIDRCIKNLRAKIEERRRRPNHILTVRGSGYRFSREGAR